MGTFVVLSHVETNWSGTMCLPSSLLSKGKSFWKCLIRRFKFSPNIEAILLVPIPLTVTWNESCLILKAPTRCHLWYKICQISKWGEHGFSDVLWSLEFICLAYCYYEALLNCEAKLKIRQMIHGKGNHLHFKLMRKLIETICLSNMFITIALFLFMSIYLLYGKFRCSLVSLDKYSKGFLTAWVAK